KRRKPPKPHSFPGALATLGRVVRGMLAGLLLGGVMSVVVIGLALLAYSGGPASGRGGLWPYRDNQRGQTTLLFLLLLLVLLVIAGFAGYAAAQSWVGAAWAVAGTYLLCFSVAGVWIEFTEGWFPRRPDDRQP